MKSSRICILKTTVSDRSQAEDLARALLNDRLAACVNIEGPCTSFYRWEGENVEDSEWQIQAKTREERAQNVIDFILDRHPYDCPEILVLDVDHAYEEYENWVQSEVH